MKQCDRPILFEDCFVSVFSEIDEEFYFPKEMRVGWNQKLFTVTMHKDTCVRKAVMNALARISLQSLEHVWVYRGVRELNGEPSKQYF